MSRVLPACACADDAIGIAHTAKTTNKDNALRMEDSFRGPAKAGHYRVGIAILGHKPRGRDERFGDENLASQTAPGRRSQSAMPAATPTLVMMRRAARNTSDNVDRAPIFHTLDAACNASVAGFQIVRMKISGRIHSGILWRSTDGSLCDGGFHFVRRLGLPLDEPETR